MLALVELTRKEVLVFVVAILAHYCQRTVALICTPHGPLDQKRREDSPGRMCICCTTAGYLGLGQSYRPSGIYLSQGCNSERSYRYNRRLEKCQEEVFNILLQRLRGWYKLQIVFSMEQASLTKLYITAARQGEPRRYCFL